MTDCKVLIVDNNKVRRKLLAGYLKQLSYPFSEAENGEQAIEKLKKESFSLVLIDINLPHIDGIEATKKIRRNLPFPINRVKIIANADCNYKDFFNKFYDVGFNDLYPKQPTLDSLKTLIEYHSR